MKTTIRSIIAAVTLAASLGASTGLANAAGNPCQTDRAFAEANECNDVYDGVHRFGPAKLAGRVR